MKIKYSLKKDHANIKKQIKKWENEIDHIVNAIQVDTAITKTQALFIADYLENISQEMMAINI